MTAGNGEGTSNTVLCIVRWIWNWLFKARQKREGQPSITQSAHGLKTEGANSPNIIANTFNYNNYHTTPVQYYKLTKEKTSGQCVHDSNPIMSDAIDDPPQLTTDIDATGENACRQLADKFYESKILAEMAKGDTWWNAVWSRFCRTASQRRELQDLVHYGLIRIPNGDISKAERTRLGDEISAIIAVEKMENRSLS